MTACLDTCLIIFFSVFRIYGEEITKSVESDSDEKFVTLVVRTMIPSTFYLFMMNPK